MDILGVLLWVWCVHAVIAAVPTLPIVFFSRKRVHWHWWEASAFILPFGIWVLLMMGSDLHLPFMPLGKTLAESLTS